MEPRLPQGNARYLWTDHDELAFLQNLGKQAYLGSETSRGVRSKSRLVLLHLYLQAGMRRNTWGTINHHRILEACRTMIREEERGQGEEA